MSRQKSELEELRELRLELKRLKKTLAEEEMRSKAYNRMIDIS